MPVNLHARLFKTSLMCVFVFCLSFVAERSFAQVGPAPGKTKEDQERNAVLLKDYDLSKYPCALTGYSGQDRQRIAALEYHHAVRTRVGPQGNYKAGMAQLPDGNIIVAACREDLDAPPSYNIHVYQSADNGESWKEIGKTPLKGKEPCLAALPNGTLVMTAQDITSQLKHDYRVHVYRSTDGGCTWEKSHLAGIDYPKSIVVEPDGSLLLIRALAPGWPGWHKGMTPNPNLQLCRSGDGGKTWTFSEGLVDWDQTMFSEVSAVRLKDGRLLVALRRQMPGTSEEAFQDIMLTESNDDGKTWCKPWRMIRTAEVHAHLIQLADGRLLATYSNYHVPWGIFAIVSNDNGKTWDLDRPYQLALSAGHSVGWAVPLQLADGSILTAYAANVYYKQTPENLVTETVRWRLPKSK